jgi:hypothetical protein
LATEQLSPRRSRARGLTLALAAALGFVLGNALADIGSSDAGPPPTLARGDGFSVRAPSAWDEIATSEPGSVRLAGPRGARVTFRRIDHPADARRAVTAIQPGTERRLPLGARLGRLEGWQYDGLRPAPDAVGTAYLVHTTGRSLLILCRAPRDSGPAALGTCADVAAGVRFERGRPVPLSVSRARTFRFFNVLLDLRDARVEGRTRVAEAALADDQAAAARSLAATYASAEHRLARSGMPRAYALAPEDLRRVEAGYYDLAAAIEIGDAQGYDAARESIVEAEDIVWRQVARLSG